MPVATLQVRALTRGCLGQVLVRQGLQRTEVVVLAEPRVDQEPSRSRQGRVAMELGLPSSPLYRPPTAVLLLRAEEPLAGPPGQPPGRPSA